MASSVTFDLFARDRASAAFTKVGTASEQAGKKVHGLNGAFGAITAGSRGLRTSFGLIGKGAALAAGAAGIGGLVAGFKGVFEEAREAQKTGAQTAAVLKSTGGVAHVSAKQVGDLATAISNKVGVDDEAIQSGENLLLTFKGVRNEAGKGNDIFNQASRTITDMTAAMNQGKVTTDGLKRSSIQVGKALNDPIKGITALTKVGVTFTDQQKKQITTLVKSGDTLGAQKIILKELNSEFGGSAEAGTTASQKLGVVFGNIKESIGTALLPAVDSVSTWLADKLPGALKVASSVAGPIFKTLGDGFSGLTAAFSGEGITSDGFVGVMERIGNAGKVANDFIRQTIIPGFQGLASAFSGEGITSDGFVGVMETIGNAARNALTWLQQTFLPGAVQVFKDLKSKVEENLPKIDLSGLATTFAEQASKWAGSIIDGVKQGLDTGDWSGLGKTVGTGLVAAIGAAGSFVGKIAGKIGDLLSKVDWVGIGIAVGKQVPSLLVGLAAGILNFDLLGLLKGLAAHWQDVLLAIIALAFTPAKIVGKVGEVLARIPLVGKLLEWGLNAMKRFADNLVGAVFAALKFFGRSFLEGFRRVFPGIGENFLAHLRNLPTYIAVVTLEVIGKAKAMMGRLGRAIADGAGGVVAKIGELIGRMLKPWATAGSWLVRKGIDLMSGLLRGIGAGFVAVGRWLGGIGARILAPYAKAGGWLLSKGREVIGGLLNGITGKYLDVRRWLGGVGTSIRAFFAKAGGWLHDKGKALIDGLLGGAIDALKGLADWGERLKNAIVNKVKEIFGISSPSKVFAELGGHMITGLIKGMISANPVGLITDVFGGVTAALRTLFSKGLISAAAGLPAKALDALGGLVDNQIAGSGSFGGNNQDIVRSLAATLYGWSGSQWTALRALIMGESGFNNTAQNPTSSAYGIFQFLNSTWGAVGARKTSDPGQQTVAGLRYIASVYGTPVNAFSAWLNRTPHWYGSGLAPTVFSSPTLIGVGERGPETVSVTPQRMLQPGRGGGDQAEVAAELRALRRDLARLPIAQVDDRYVRRSQRYLNGRDPSGW